MVTQLLFCKAQEILEDGGQHLYLPWEPENIVSSPHMHLFEVQELPFRELQFEQKSQGGTKCMWGREKEDEEK